MGGSTHNDDVYKDRLAFAHDTGTPVFKHDADIKTGAVAAAVHASLDPTALNKAGKIVRESFDSDAHPDSVPVAVLFDVTGSMAGIPVTFVEKLGKLMSILVKKGYLAHPHVLFGAIGDATHDKFPLQVGQFEAGNEMDAALTNIILEGEGGGHNTESYELGAYFLARHADLDSVKKRGKKGYCFFMGDELPYPEVNRKQVQKYIGDKLEANIRFAQNDPRSTDANGDILAELREKFEVFWIMPGGTNHWNDSYVINTLKALFGQNMLRLEDAIGVCELIATTIGVCEGVDTDTIAVDLRDLGSSSAAVTSATMAVANYASTRSVTKHATASGSLVETGDDSVARL